MKQISFFIAVLLCLAIYSCSDDGELVEETIFCEEEVTIKLEGVFDPSLSLLRNGDTVMQAFSGDPAMKWKGFSGDLYDITTPAYVNYQLVNTNTGELYTDTTIALVHQADMKMNFFSFGGGVAPMLIGELDTLAAAPEGYVSIRFINLGTGPIENKTIDLVYYQYLMDPDTYSFVMDTTVLAKVEGIAYNSFDAIMQVPIFRGPYGMEENSDQGVGMKAYDSSTGELLTESGISDGEYNDEMSPFSSLYIFSNIDYSDYNYSNGQGCNLVTILITDYPERTELYGAPMYHFKKVDALSIE